MALANYFYCIAREQDIGLSLIFSFDWVSEFNHERLATSINIKSRNASHSDCIVD